MRALTLSFFLLLSPITLLLPIAAPALAEDGSGAPAASPDDAATGDVVAQRSLERVPRASSSASAKPSVAREPNEGSLAAEIVGATLGDLLGTAFTFAITVPSACLDCEDDGLMLGMGVGWATRPFAVGGLTAALARPSQGEGRALAAMFGSMPGVALIATSWMTPQGSAFAPYGVAGGHVLAIAGSVAGYRYSARRRGDRREPEKGLQWMPSASADKDGMSLSLSGRF